MDKKINYGIIGAGHLGRYHVQQILNIKKVALVGVYDLNLSKSKFKHDQIQNLLMVAKKNKSFDKRFKGDFELKINQLSKEKINNYIFTGCQIINKDLFSSFENTAFSISKIWDDLIKDNKLYGFESLNEFVHVTDLEIYNKLVKN